MRGNLARAVPFAGTVRPGWYPDWTGRTCAILGAGDSLTQADCDQIRQAGIKTIAVNRSHELAPWADALYGCDGKFWDHYETARQFAGLKITQEAEAAEKWGLKRVVLRQEISIILEPGIIGSGGNGGFQALNIGIQFGGPTALLAGFDMRGSHWHGHHPRGLNNPDKATFAMWINAFNAVAATLIAIGVRVINVTPDSALECFEKMPLPEALRACAS